MFPRSAEKFRFIFIPVVLFIILFSPVVPLWAKSLKVDSPWLTSGRNNQLLKIRFYDQSFVNTSKVKIDLGVGVQVASYQYNPKEKELFLKIKSVAKETNLGPRPLIIKIPSKRTTLKNSKYKQIKSKIWIFSPGMVKVDQSHFGKKKCDSPKNHWQKYPFQKGSNSYCF